MQTPSTLWIWLNEQAWPLGLIALICGLVLFYLYWSARSRQVRMNESRAGVNEQTFVRSLEVEGFDAGIASRTYQYLQNRQHVSFPIHPEDRLDEELGLGLEEVEESVQELLAATERLYQPGLQHTPIVTVEDLVRFIQASPRLSEMAA